MKAILSDIHSNLEALQAVLQDIGKYQVEAIYCLGDTVGYGPNPRECLELVMPFQLVLLGNHDQAVIFDPKDFNPVAERATFWTRRQLEAPIPNRATADRRWEFLAELQSRFEDGDWLFVHGSARNPVNEYVFPEDIYNQRKLDRIFPLIKRYCFQGHTHIPGVFTEDKRFASPEEVDHTWKLDNTKTMINVGSVGQPRDGDSRACYVLLEGQTVTFRRVDYDVGATVTKIHDVPDLDKFLGDRLRKGR